MKRVGRRRGRMGGQRNLELVGDKAQSYLSTDFWHAITGYENFV